MKWLLPSGMKSLSLSTDFRRGPALIAFIDAQPLSVANRLLSVVRIAFGRVHLYTFCAPLPRSPVSLRIGPCLFPGLTSKWL